MCERMLGSKGVVFMTWWWMPVLVASRLSVVGYTSRPAHKMENVQDYADALDPGKFLYFWSLQAVSHPITYCYGNYLGLDALFAPPSLKPSVWAFCIFVLSCKHSDDDNRSPFELCLVHAIFTQMITKRYAFLDHMSFADGWPRCEEILAMILCLSILSLSYWSIRCSAYSLAALIALVNLGTSRAYRS